MVPKAVALHFGLIQELEGEKLGQGIPWLLEVQVLALHINPEPGSSEAVA